MGAAPEMGGAQRAESLTEEKGGNLLVLSWGWGPWERRGWAPRGLGEEQGQAWDNPEGGRQPGNPEPHRAGLPLSF